MDFKKILTGLLSKAYKVDEGRMAEILEKNSEDEILSDLLEEDRNRVLKLTPKPGEDSTSKFQEGYKKAKKEERAAFEKELKEEYGIESDLQGKDLIEHIVTTKTAESTKGKKGEMTEDEIKASPVYRSAEKAWKKTLQEKEEGFAKQLEDLEAGFTTKQTIGSFQEEALKEFDALKPVLPKDAKKAHNQRSTFAKELLAEGMEVRKEDGGFVLLKNGKVLDDGHGNSIDWKDWVKSRAGDLFEFEANNGGSNSGNSNDKTEGGAQGGNCTGKAKYPDGITKPADFEAYSKIVQDKNIPLADRQAVSAAWSAENGRTE